MEWFPEHKASLTLTHNEHRDYYESVEDWEAFHDDGTVDWLSQEQRAKAIETDSVWCLQWYPDTPVGFCRLFAADLEALEAHFRAKA